MTKAEDKKIDSLPQYCYSRVATRVHMQSDPQIAKLHLVHNFIPEKGKYKYNDLSNNQI